MTAEPVRAAAVQMQARLGDVDFNLAKAAKLADEALGNGAALVVLPEFFTTAVGFSGVMDDAALPLEGRALSLLTERAKKHRATVTGSFIAIHPNGSRKNTWVLALADGSYRTHDKDLPTMWENCYYEPGDDDGVLDTPDGPVGAAMCWELVRMQTPRRLRGKVDLLVGGSCWWDLPQRVPIPGSKRISKRNHEIMADTPGRFARLVGAPFVHAAHVGDFSCGTPLAPGLSYDSFYLGEAQIVDAHGEILARRTRQEGEGILYADVIPGRIAPGEALADRYWIPEFPAVIRMAWSFQNAHGRRYYNRHFASGARQL